MAQLVIRNASTGQQRTIGEGAWPFFEPGGWVIIGVVGEVSSVPPPLQAAPQVVVHGDDPNVARPTTNLPVIWFGTVDPVNSDDTKDVTVYVASES